MASWITKKKIGMFLVRLRSLVVNNNLSLFVGAWGIGLGARSMGQGVWGKDKEYGDRIPEHGDSYFLIRL